MGCSAFCLWIQGKTPIPVCDAQRPSPWAIWGNSQQTRKRWGSGILIGLGDVGYAYSLHCSLVSLAGLTNFLLRVQPTKGTTVETIGRVLDGYMQLDGHGVSQSGHRAMTCERRTDFYADILAQFPCRHDRLTMTSGPFGPAPNSPSSWWQARVICLVD